MKIYIAGPMTGHPEYNYPAFDDAQRQLRYKGYQAISPAIHNITGPIQPWEFYVKAGIALLATCEAVATLDGWEGSKGATIEVTLARALDMEVKPVEEWLT